MIPLRKLFSRHGYVTFGWYRHRSMRFFCQEPEVKDNMTENEIMTLNWLPGVCKEGIIRDHQGSSGGSSGIPYKSP